jgi:hypothetical protein
MKNEFDYRFDILMKELDIIVSSIRSYDSILFRIKSWAVTIFSGFVLFAAKDHSSVYISFGALAVILFWCIDAQNKSIQRMFITRYNKIEHFLRSSQFKKAVESKSFSDLVLPDITGHLSVSDRDKKINALKAAIMWHTAFPYLSMLIILACVAAYLSFKY